MPVLGFGVYKSPADVTERSVTTALKTGYRHIGMCPRDINIRVACFQTDLDFIAFWSK